MPPSHVRLRFTGPAPPPEDRDQFKEELALVRCLDKTALSIRYDRIYPLPDGIKVMVHDESDVDKILSECCKKLLLEIGLEPFASPEKVARQTIVVRTYSAIIHRASEAELIQEIRKTHKTINITSIWKNQAMGILKIVCKTTTEANKLKQTELKLYGYTMKTDNLEYAEYIHITQCLHCYRLDSHVTTACRDNNTYCGECGSTEHRHTECRNTDPGCINCIRANAPATERRHKARSNMCPQKKRILRKKRRELGSNEDAQRTDSPARTFQDAPLPASNPWLNPGGRSQSRGRGRGASRGTSRGRGRGGSRGPASRPRTATPTVPSGPTSAAQQTPTAPANTDQTYPELAHNRAERKNKNKKKKNKQAQQQQQQQNPKVQYGGTSASVPAGNGMLPPPQDMEVQEAPAYAMSAAPVARAVPGVPAATAAAPVVYAAPHAVPHPQAQPRDPSEITVILTACHQHNMVRPGEFEAKAKYLLAKNNWPPVLLGNDWHSAEYIAMVSGKGNTNPGTCQCQCKCQGRPQLHTPAPISTAPIPPTQLSPEIQEAPLTSLTQQPPYPLTAVVKEVVLLDDGGEMETSTQGVKRRRDQPEGPSSSPSEDANNQQKRANHDISPDSPPVLQISDTAAPNILDDITVELTGEGRHGTISDLLESLSPPKGDETAERQSHDESQTTLTDPLSPGDVFADADDGTAGDATPQGTGDDLPEIKSPTKLMPPPEATGAVRKQRVPSGGRRRVSSSGTSRSRSHSQPRTPGPEATTPPSPKGQTPLKRTTSHLSCAKPLPSTPTYSQLDRALEEAIESDSHESRDSRGRKIVRSRKPGKLNTVLSPIKLLNELDAIKQATAAAEIVHNRIEITTGKEETRSTLTRNLKALSVKDLVTLWKRGVITLEVKPRTPAPKGQEEPVWRKEKYETLTRILYEEKIGEKEWEKYEGKLHLSLQPPSLVSAAALINRVQAVRSKVQHNHEKYQNNIQLENFLSKCQSPSKTVTQLTNQSMADPDFFVNSQAEPSNLETPPTPGKWTPATTNNSYNQCI